MSDEDNIRIVANVMDACSEGGILGQNDIETIARIVSTFLAWRSLEKDKDK